MSFAAPLVSLGMTGLRLRNPLKVLIADGFIFAGQRNISAIWQQVSA
jgi:hypothetical protein